MMSSWLRGSSHLQLEATQDIRLQSLALLGFRHSLVVASVQRHRAQSIAASAYRCKEVTREENVLFACRPQQQSCSVALLNLRVIGVVVHTAARTEANRARAEVPQGLAGLEETLGHLAGTHSQRHLPPDLNGELYA